MYPYTLAASSSLAYPLIPLLMAHSGPVNECETMAHGAVSGTHFLPRVAPVTAASGDVPGGKAASGGLTRGGAANGGVTAGWAASGGVTAVTAALVAVGNLAAAGAAHAAGAHTPPLLIST